MHWSNPTGGASVSCYLRKSPCELLPSRRPPPPKCSRSSINCRPRGSRHSNISKFWRATRDAFSEQAILQLLLLAGHYRTNAYVSVGLQVPVDPRVKRPFPV